MSGQPVDQLDEADEHQVLVRTVRYLRIGMVFLVLLLFVAVALEASSSGRWLDSLSDYYYTPVHAVFVATLCAIGICLIVYRGSSALEDLVLTGCGFLTFLVALVPTGADPAAGCTPAAGFCQVPSATVAANVTALLVTAAAALLLALGLALFGRRPGQSSPLASGTGWAAFVVLVVAFVGVVAFFVGWRATFLRVGHYGAAVLFFVGILAVVGLNGNRLGPDELFGRRMPSALMNRYALTFYLMVGSTLVIVAAGTLGGLAHWVLVLQAGLILQFGTFWVTQTVERWDA